MKSLNEWMLEEIRRTWASKVWCFSAVMQDGAYGLGIAIANTPGYVPLPLSEACSESYEQMWKHANHLNDRLGWPQAYTMRIIGSTMAAQNVKNGVAP